MTDNHIEAATFTDNRDLLDAAQNLIACASDTYKKRNGHISSFEDDSGEKCWIIPFDAFEQLRTAAEDVIATSTAQRADDTNEDDIIEAMVLSLCDPFPSESLGRTGAIDYWRDLMRKAYRAVAVTAHQPNLRVKQLDWRTDACGSLTATHEFGNYTCQRFHEAWDLMRNGIHIHPRIHGVIQTYPSLEAAKEAAQADLEKRSLSIFELSPLRNSVPPCLHDRTFAIQHNPNCPSPWLVRLPGDNGVIDLKPYGDAVGIVEHETGDHLGFGKTLIDATHAAITKATQSPRKPADDKHIVAPSQPTGPTVAPLKWKERPDSMRNTFEANVFGYTFVVSSNDRAYFFWTTCGMTTITEVTEHASFEAAKQAAQTAWEAMLRDVGVANHQAGEGRGDSSAAVLETLTEVRDTLIKLAWEENHSMLEKINATLARAQGR